MSDQIPVGSPPAPPGRHAAPGGWYADPADEGQERYWDGWQWTRNVRPRPGTQRRSPAQPSVGPHPEGGREPAGYRPVAPPAQNAWEPWQSGPSQPGFYKRVLSTADGVPLAGWWWRVLAYIIDFFLVYAVVEIISRIVGWSTAINRAMNEYTAYLTEIFTTGGDFELGRALELASPPEAVYVNITTMVLFVIYSGLMLSVRGATLGKLVCRLRVVPVDQGRSTPGLPPATAWLRPLVTKLLEVVPFAQAVDFLFPLWDKRRQTLHDKLVRTQVIREPRRLR